MKNVFKMGIWTILTLVSLGNSLELALADELEDQDPSKVELNLAPYVTTARELNDPGLEKMLVDLDQKISKVMEIPGSKGNAKKNK